VLTVEANGSEIVCMGTSAPQTHVLVRVPPDDVMLYPTGEERPRSSARNTFDAEVTGIRRAGAALAVELETGAGALVATVLPASAREIDLAEGAHVTASFKATAARAFDSSVKEAS
jgi:molybdopterin-binding protein